MIVSMYKRSEPSSWRTANDHAKVQAPTTLVYRENHIYNDHFEEKAQQTIVSNKKLSEDLPPDQLDVLFWAKISNVRPLF